MNAVAKEGLRAAIHDLLVTGQDEAAKRGVSQGLAATIR